MQLRALCALLPLIVGGCLERTQATVLDTPRPVQAVKVALAPTETTRRYAGLIRPRHEADLGFRVGGRMVERSVDVGQKVTAGQVLAKLDPTDLNLALRRAESDLAAAAAQDTQAQAEAQRYATLTRQGHASASEDDARQAQARTGRQRVIGAQAALQLAQNRLDYAVLRAPADGVVTAIMADPGTVVTEGTPVLRLADTAAPEAEIFVPETVVSELRGQRATVTLWTRPDEPLQARLREVSPSADPKLRTYTARFTIEDPPAWLALGMTASVALTSEAAAPIATLPASALADRGEGPSVWIVDPATGRLTAQPVRIQAMRQDTVLVAGVPDGAMVVTLGVQKLDPAARVRIAENRPGPARRAE